MRKDSRLSRVLHILVHMDAINRPVTSEQMAKMISTNPVVVRRTMSLLRKAEYVTSTKGHNGGWQLSTRLENITLLDIHKALGDSSVFTIGLTDEHSECMIEQAVNTALKDVMNDAEALMLQRFGQITLDRFGSVSRHRMP